MADWLLAYKEWVVKTMGKVKMDESGVEAMKNLASTLPDAIRDIDESSKQLKESFEQNKELLGPHSEEIANILECIDEAQKVGNQSVVKIQKKLIAAAAMLAAIIDKSFTKESAVSTESDISASNVIKDLADQNVTKSVLPKQGSWSDETKAGNCEFILSDDAKVTWNKNGHHECTGKELKEWMKSNYETDTVTYDHKEPDFKPFADPMIGEITVDKMSTERGGGEGTFDYAIRVTAEKNNMTKEEVKKYMSEHELTWHECADRHTILAVPTRINSTFKHSGGISVQKSIEAMVATIAAKHGKKWVLNKDKFRGPRTVIGLDKAIKAQHDAFKKTKKDKFVNKKNK